MDQSRAANRRSLDVQRRVTDDNAIINAQILTSLVAIPFNRALLVPNQFFSFSPRFDYQLNPGNTLVVRYSYSKSKADNVGASDFSLPERAFSRSNTTQTFQVTETAILSPVLMNETRFQYIRTRGEQNGNNTLPTILVQDAFISGGSQVGLAHNNEDRWELQNYSTWTKGRHILRFGARLRGVSINDFSPQNFGGTFIFSGGEAPQLDANNQIVLDKTATRFYSDHQSGTLSPNPLVPGQSEHARARRWRDAVFDRRRQSGSVSKANGYGSVCAG